MCTVTLEYDPTNALARRKLNDLLSSGLFLQKDSNDATIIQQKKDCAQLRAAFFAKSRKSTAPIISKYL